MKITIAKNEAEFDRIAAWRIIKMMLEKHEAVIGLSTGQTTTNMHRIVSEIFAMYPFDVSGITIFNVDELTNLPREYSGSCYTMILNQLVKPLGINEENIKIALLHVLANVSNSLLKFAGADSIRHGQCLRKKVQGHPMIRQTGGKSRAKKCVAEKIEYLSESIQT